MRTPLAIITPTLGRVKFLAALSDCIRRQTSTQWLWIIVHDGPLTQRAKQNIEERCPAATVLELPAWTGNYGSTPRLVGAQQALAMGAQYSVFWDDDNYFHPDAVRRIREQVEANNYPTALLMRVDFGSKLIPPLAIPPSKLQIGQLDTANLVLKTSVSVHAYSQVLDRGVSRATDYFALQSVLDMPECRVATSEYCVGIYDGLRPSLIYLRRVGIRSNLVYWFSYNRIYYTARKLVQFCTSYWNAPCVYTLDDPCDISKK